MKPIFLPLKNLSGIITSGGTAQDLYAANDAPRHSFLFQNVSDTDMTLEFGATAVAGTGILVAAGLAYEPPPHVLHSGKCSVLCATTGKAFVCKIS